MTPAAIPVNHAAPAPAWVIVALIVIGLIVDQHAAVGGQLAVSIATWALLLYWIAHSSPAVRLTLIVCVIYATLGEIFLSLVWGLYEYRLGNIPLFVPPGHALLFTLGAILSTRLRDWVIWAVPLLAAPVIIGLAWTRSDTLGPPLYALLVVCIIFSGARKLYAVMFMLALAMEIYGTALGNWTWQRDVPWLRLTTLNPPLAAGAFYCVLDLLVVVTTTPLKRWLREPPAGEFREW